MLGYPAGDHCCCDTSMAMTKKQTNEVDTTKGGGQNDDIDAVFWANKQRRSTPLFNVANGQLKA